MPRPHEATSNLVRVSGHVWELEGQAQQAYWMNLELADELSLFFELSGTPRQKKHALDLHSRAENIEWVHRFEGEVAFENRTLVLRSLRPAG